MELTYDLILHVVHVAGKRMIDQGADTLSRADYNVGVVQGIDIRRFPRFTWMLWSEDRS
jgi:hypothetical protein